MQNFKVIYPNIFLINLKKQGMFGAAPAAAAAKPATGGFSFGGSTTTTTAPATSASVTVEKIT